MATPMTASQQVAQFKKWGIDFREYRNWRTHNRGNRGTGWGPVNGLQVHHTGSDSKDQRELLYNGFPDLPGPLSQWGLAQNGTLWGIGNGRCNHAGLGDDDVLRAVQREDYGAYPPPDNEANTDGNSRFYGVEIWYSGSHGMTHAQYVTLCKLGAAILDFHNWGEKSVIAHGEWQPGKWDPGYANGRMMDMNAVRQDIGTTLQNGSSPVADETKPAVRPDGYDDVWRVDAMPVDYLENPENPYWWPENVLRDIHKRLVRVEEMLRNAENG